jgi:hypothetical protein
MEKKKAPAKIEEIYAAKILPDENKDIREHVIFARVRKGLYGRVFHASKETGVSMSRLTEMSLEKYLDEIIKDVNKEMKRIKYG